jgi:hypothetical protein
VSKRFPITSVAALACFLSACTQSADALDGVKTSSIRPNAYSGNERDCLARAMFFESNRSSREGLIAVGTVVINRVKSIIQIRSAAWSARRTSSRPGC